MIDAVTIRHVLSGRSAGTSGERPCAATDPARTLSVFLLTLSVALACASERAFAFHEGGVGHCSGCHTTHNSQDGIPNNADTPFGIEALLLYENPTDLCLSCHAESFGAVLSPNPLLPLPEIGGGDFTFLLEDNLNDTVGALAPIDGSHGGHNVVSQLWGIPVDAENGAAPGGTYASANLGCISCHDPHGNDNFRMLRGRGSVDPSGFVFTEPAPTAQGIPLDAVGESRDLHTAYNFGWADWCANCHGRFHEGFNQTFEHPIDRGLSGEARANYNDYDGPDRLFDGSYETAYIPEVPFEDVNGTPTSTTGAFGPSRVMCMSCHRAHATSAPYALRWDPNVEFLVDDGFESGSYPIPSPYPDPNQRSLCVKCHYTEAYEHGFGRPCMECHRNLND